MKPSTIWSRLKLLFTYKGELNIVVKNIRAERIAKERLSTKDNLHLCYAHRQEANYSHYLKKNCDYCKLLKQLDKQK